jgi:hypothetical protein
MKTNALNFAALVLVCCAGLPAQNVVFQQAGAIGVGGIAINDFAGPVKFGPMPAGQTVTGNPFSGAEQRHSLQVLGDGTHIEQTESTKIARDSQGRTRTETVPRNSDLPAIVTIQDPAAGVTWLLDPAHKIANKLPMPSFQVTKNLGPGGATSVASTRAISAVNAPARAMTLQAQGAPGEAGQVVIHAMAGAGGADAGPGVETEVRKFDAASSVAPVQEDLGTQNINGVVAKGTRSTITIPAGQIGNDRALQVVNERWYSDDLVMLVKSSNSDPRFGTTEFELTNISRAAPDPSLFQVPSDYFVNEGKLQVRTGSLK